MSVEVLAVDVGEESDRELRFGNEHDDGSLPLRALTSCTDFDSIAVARSSPSTDLAVGYDALFAVTVSADVSGTATPCRSGPGSARRQLDGAVKTYFNPAGRLASVADTAAF